MPERLPVTTELEAALARGPSPHEREIWRTLPLHVRLAHRLHGVRPAAPRPPVPVAPLPPPDGLPQPGVPTLNLLEPTRGRAARGPEATGRPRPPRRRGSLSESINPEGIRQHTVLALREHDLISRQFALQALCDHDDPVHVERR